MEHNYKHTQPESMAAKIGLGMVALDSLSDMDFNAALKEFNQTAPTECRINSDSTPDDMNPFYLWYYETKVNPLKTNTLQN